MLRCENCAHWQATDRAGSFAAPCGVGSYPGRVSFDQSCRQHSSAAQPTPAPDMQSQARALPWGPWGVPNKP